MEKEEAITACLQKVYGRGIANNSKKVLGFIYVIPLRIVVLGFPMVYTWAGWERERERGSDWGKDKNFIAVFFRCSTWKLQTSLRVREIYSWQETLQTLTDYQIMQGRLLRVTCLARSVEAANKREEIPEHVHFFLVKVLYFLDSK